MIYEPGEAGSTAAGCGCLIVPLVGVVTIIILALLGPAVGNVFSNITMTL